jgi:protein TonB
MLPSGVYANNNNGGVAMFEDSLLESGGRLARRNPWTTAFSFGVQIFAGGILVLMSLVYTETLPTQRVFNILEAPAPPPPAAPEQPQATQATHSTSEFAGNVLVPPREIPQHIGAVVDEVPPGNPLANTGIGVQDSVGTGGANTALNDLMRNVPVKVPTASVNRVRVSTGVAQGLLIRQVKPGYPPLARQARVQGTVVLQAVIGKDGTVQDLHVVSGHPLLTGAAIAAARQWLYRPYYLNGEPVEVDTQINVIFTLAGE